MFTPQQNAKIAQLVEAIESLVTAVTLPRTTDEYEREIREQHILDARVEMHDALGEFLLPSIRVIDGGPQKSEVDIECASCHQHQPCMTACPSWAKAIRDEVHRSADPAA